MAVNDERGETMVEMTSMTVSPAEREMVETFRADMRVELVGALDAALEAIDKLAGVAGKLGSTARHELRGMVEYRLLTAADESGDALRRELATARGLGFNGIAGDLERQLGLAS